MTENPDLLNLHAQQKHPSCPGEYKVKASGWIKALASALQKRLANTQSTLFKKKENVQNTPNHELITPLALKLDAMADLLNLSSYDDIGRYKRKLHPVSHAAIQPVYVICPISSTCETESCNPHGLQQATKARDIPLVTLIKGTTIHHNVPVQENVHHAIQVTLQIMNTFLVKLKMTRGESTFCCLQKTCQTQIDTKLVHKTCAGHISRTTCLISLISFVTHSPTCTAGPSALNLYNFFLKPFLTSPASICLNLSQLEAT